MNAAEAELVHARVAIVGAGSIGPELSVTNIDAPTALSLEFLTPTSFIGGLGDPHELADSLALRGGWHLVRYARS